MQVGTHNYALSLLIILGDPYLYLHCLFIPFLWPASLGNDLGEHPGAPLVLLERHLVVQLVKP